MESACCTYNYIYDTPSRPEQRGMCKMNIRSMIWYVWYLSVCEGGWNSRCGRMRQWTASDAQKSKVGAVCSEHRQQRVSALLEWAFHRHGLISPADSSGVFYSIREKEGCGRTNSVTCLPFCASGGTRFPRAHFIMCLLAINNACIYHMHPTVSLTHTCNHTIITHSLITKQVVFVAPQPPLFTATATTVMSNKWDAA